ncbi:Saccharopine dehydrogenase-domain-containing protein [Xylariaceae sp. FL1019]|nr:Saccharopine dehydrogenase-domain-containing protein [Xylariaceae sp. FL1019]
MSDPVISRKYDIVILGATGYTGRLTTEHVARHLPADLKWAIAGRSYKKLEKIAAKVKSIDPHRSQPSIETVAVDNDTQLDALVKSTKVCISIIYYRAGGELVIESCIRSKTDYLDALGDPITSREYINKYHKLAKTAGVAIIQACSFVSAPQDLLAYAVSQELRTKANVSTKEAICSIVEAAANPSGGSFAGIIDSILNDPADAVREAHNPFTLSPVKRSSGPTPSGILGLRKESNLGLLSAAVVTAFIDTALVNRTWGLLQERNAIEAYGKEFTFFEYQKVNSAMGGLMHAFVTAVMNTILSLSFMGHVLKRVVPEPGTGPDVEKTIDSPFKFEIVATGETDNDGTERRVYGILEYPSDSYHFTGASLAQGAASLLYERGLVGGFTGGVLTPAILGQDFVQRLKGIGVKMEVRMID